MAAEKHTFADLRLIPRLRTATLILLGIVPLFLALDLRYQRARLPALLVFYAVHVVVAGGALLATFTRTGRQRPDHVTLLLIVGVATNVNAYFHRTPANPALAADVLTLLMMSSAMFFSWSLVRHLIVCVVTCGGFAIAGLTVPNAPPAFGYALGVLVLGATVATIGSRVLGRYRENRLVRLRKLLAARQEEIADLREEIAELEKLLAKGR